MGVTKVLIKNGITSAPVYDKKAKSYVGMFDYRDIVDYVLVVFRKKNMDTIPEDEQPEIHDIIRKAMTGEKVSLRYAAGKRKAIE
jgi:predicted transcriptional regulator